MSQVNQHWRRAWRRFILVVYFTPCTWTESGRIFCWTPKRCLTAYIRAAPSIHGLFYKPISFKENVLYQSEEPTEGTDGSEISEG